MLVLFYFLFFILFFEHVERIYDDGMAKESYEARVRIKRGR